MEPAWEGLIAWKGAAVALAFAALCTGEWLRPAARRPRPPWPRLAKNGGLWLVNSALSLIVILPITAWAAGLGVIPRPAWWAGLPGFMADLVLLDFLIYWWHRANHEWPPLWRFHHVHHLDRFLDTTTAVRFHAGEVLLSALARAAVIVALGFPLASVLVFEALLLVATIFHHSNLGLPHGLERNLARVVITPSIHWVHHHARRTDTDSNYGTIFSFWDPIFGTRSPTTRRLDMGIGVEGRDELGFAGLLFAPFAPQAGPTARASRG